jgi:hypothetical protein
MTEEKNPAAVKRGRSGGSKGGKARAAKMTKEERSESARMAANARWAKKREEDIARARSLAGSEIHIRREHEGYMCSITSQDSRRTYWTTSGPMTRDELIKELRNFGWHQTDIGDAFYAADPDWLSS